MHPNREGFTRPLAFDFAAALALGNDLTDSTGGLRSAEITAESDNNSHHAKLFSSSQQSKDEKKGDDDDNRDASGWDRKPSKFLESTFRNNKKSMDDMAVPSRRLQPGNEYFKFHSSPVMPDNKTETNETTTKTKNAKRPLKRKYSADDSNVGNRVTTSPVELRLEGHMTLTAKMRPHSLKPQDDEATPTRRYTLEENTDEEILASIDASKNILSRSFFQKLGHSMMETQSRAGGHCRASVAVLTGTSHHTTESDRATKINETTATKTDRTGRDRSSTSVRKGRATSVGASPKDRRSREEKSSSKRGQSSVSPKERDDTSRRDHTDDKTRKRNKHDKSRSPIDDSSKNHHKEDHSRRIATEDHSRRKEERSRVHLKDDSSRRGHERRRRGHDSFNNSRGDLKDDSSRRLLQDESSSRRHRDDRRRKTSPTTSDGNGHTESRTRHKDSQHPDEHKNRSRRHRHSTSPNHEGPSKSGKTRLRDSKSTAEKSGRRRHSTSPQKESDEHGKHRHRRRSKSKSPRMGHNESDTHDVKSENRRRRHSTSPREGGDGRRKGRDSHSPKNDNRRRRDSTSPIEDGDGRRRKTDCRSPKESSGHRRPKSKSERERSAHRRYHSTDFESTPESSPFADEMKPTPPQPTPLSPTRKNRGSLHAPIAAPKQERDKKVAKDKHRKEEKHKIADASSGSHRMHSPDADFPDISGGVGSPDGRRSVPDDNGLTHGERTPMRHKSVEDQKQAPVNPRKTRSEQDTKGFSPRGRSPLRHKSAEEQKSRKASPEQVSRGSSPRGRSAVRHGSAEDLKFPRSASLERPRRKFAPRQRSVPPTRGRGLTNQRTGEAGKTSKYKEALLEQELQCDQGENKRETRQQLRRHSSLGWLEKKSRGKRESMLDQHMSSPNLFSDECDTPAPMSRARMGFLDEEMSLNGSEDERNNLKVSQSRLVNSIKEMMREKSGRPKHRRSSSEGEIKEKIFDSEELEFELDEWKDNPRGAVAHRVSANLDHVDLTALRPSPSSDRCVPCTQRRILK